MVLSILFSIFLSGFLAISPNVFSVSFFLFLYISLSKFSLSFSSSSYPSNNLSCSPSSSTYFSTVFSPYLSSAFFLSFPPTSSIFICLFHSIFLFIFLFPSFPILSPPSHTILPFLLILSSSVLSVFNSFSHRSFPLPPPSLFVRPFLDFSPPFCSFNLPPVCTCCPVFKNLASVSTGYGLTKRIHFLQ
jgi:hypothetical protein